MNHEHEHFTVEQENLWRTYREATSAINAHLDSRLKDEADIKLNDFYILLALVQAGDDGVPVAVRMGDLADQTNVSPSRLTYQIDVLQRRGWVEKAPVASDRRGKGILLTAAGRGVYEVAARTYNREVRETVLRELDSTNTGVFTRFLNGVLRNIELSKKEGSRS